MCHISLCHNLSNREAEAWSTVFQDNLSFRVRNSLNYGVGERAAINYEHLLFSKVQIPLPAPTLSTHNHSQGHT